MIEYFFTKLARWKRRHITFGKRFELIKSALSNMPIYHMSLFKMSAGVIKKPESIHKKNFMGQLRFEKKSASGVLEENNSEKESRGVRH